MVGRTDNYCQSPASDILAHGYCGGIIAVAIHPGGVKVEKLAAYDLPGFIEPSASIEAMIQVIDKLQPSDSGKFLNYTGETLPW